MTSAVHNLKEFIARQMMRWHTLRRALRGGNEQVRFMVVRFVAFRLPLSDAGKQSVMTWGLNHLVERQRRSLRSRLRSAQLEWDREGHERLQQLLAGTVNLECPATVSPQVSFVLVIFNKAHLSLLSIQSVLRFADLNYELIVVDNGSTDLTSSMLDRIKGVKILRNASNTGFGPACMQAAATAIGEFLCFLNNDALVIEGSISTALKSFENSIVGAVGGKILLANGRLQEAGSIIWSDGSALGYGRGDDPELPHYNFRRPVDYCSAAFLFTPRSLFFELGGFKEEFAPAYYEDTDYCLRVWQHGLQVVYEPRAVIRHFESASSGGNEAAQLQMAANQSKFVEVWEQTLPRYLAPATSNVLRARIAASSTGL